MVHAKTDSCPPASLTRAKRPQGIRKETPRPLRRSARHQSVHSAPENIDPSRPKRKPIDTSGQPAQKRQRPASTTAEDVHPETASDEAGSNNPIDYWRKHQHWPRAFFESRGGMDHLLARRRSTSTLRRKTSVSSANSSNITPTQSDQKPREAKSAPDRDARYEALLEAKNSFLRKDDAGVKKEAKKLCQHLLEMEQAAPEDTLFSEDIFDETCEMRNEARLIRYITLLIVPSAEIHTIRRPRPLSILVETVNEGWTKSVPLFKPRPQPDYSVGFRPSAFSEKHLQRLKPFIGTALERSYFAATRYMYFPFLTYEVKCGAAALDVADRQNAHSATLAVRAVVELFRGVGRESEVNREILAFSISYDHSTVRIYGHYPVINGKETKYYHHKIHAFDFTVLDGKERWTAYKFTKNIYDSWVPDHFKRICSAIDDIPEVDYDVSQSELQFSSQTGLSQGLESHHLSQSEESASVAPQDGQSVASVGATTPDTSISQSFKKPRRK